MAFVSFLATTAQSSSSCDYCSTCGSSCLLTVDESHFPADDWEAKCGHTGRPCLINVAEPFRLPWKDLVALSSAITAEGATTDQDHLSFEQVRRLSDVSHGPPAADGTRLWPEWSVEFVEAAQHDPADFFRRWANATAMQHGRDHPTPASTSDFEWYVSWYDNEPQELAQEIMQRRLDDSRLSFMPASWERGASFWVFVGWVSSGSPLQGRAGHLDTIAFAAGTFHLQLQGRKMWRLKPADACQASCGSETLEVVVHPGQYFSVHTGRWLHETVLLPRDGGDDSGGEPRRPLTLGVARDYYAPGASMANGAAYEWPPFGQMDADGNGVVSHRELTHFEIRKVVAGSDPPLRDGKVVDMVESLSESDVAFFETAMRMKLASADVNGDGVLVEAEVVAAAQRGGLGLLEQRTRGRGVRGKEEL
jgi:hypothetical protein